MDISELLGAIYEENKDKIKAIPYHPFNVEKANLWATSQPDRFQLFCRLFLKYQIHVSGEEFLEAVSRLGNDIESRMLGGKYDQIVVCAHHALDISKSNFWVLLLLFPYIGKYLAATGDDIYECYDFVLSSGEEHRYLIIVPDDMSYSGTQMGEIFKGALQVLKHRFKDDPQDWDDFKTIDSDPKYARYLRDTYGSISRRTDILIAVPYLSLKAYNYLIEVSSRAGQVMASQDLPVKFSDVTRRIVPFDKLIGKDGDQIEVPWACVDFLDNSAIYFDHKLATNISSFPIIYDDAPVVSEDGKSTVYRLGSLIENCPEDKEDSSHCPKGFYKGIQYTYQGSPFSLGGSSEENDRESQGEENDED